MTPRGFIFSIWTFLCIVPISAQTWITVRPGLELLRGNFADQQSVHFVLLRYDLRKKNQLRIVDTYSEMGSQKSYSEFSVDAIQHKTGAVVVVNAGSTKNLAIPNPAGLLKVKGTIISELNPQNTRGGILCIGKEGAIINYSSVTKTVFDFSQ